MNTNFTHNLKIFFIVTIESYSHLGTLRKNVKKYHFIAHRQCKSLKLELNTVICINEFSVHE